MARTTKSWLSAPRAAFRVARRDVWRHRGRSALIGVMIALPVLAASTVSVIYRSDQNEPRDIVQLMLGDQAQAHITYFGGGRIIQGPQQQDYSTEERDGPQLKTEAQVRSAFQSRIPAQDRLITDVTLSENYGPGSVQFGNQLFTAQIREIDYAADGLDGLFETRSGRAPARSGEVAVSERLARASGLKVGDSFTLALPLVVADPVESRTVSVVGVVGGAAANADSAVLAVPGSVIPADAARDAFSGVDGAVSIAWLVAGPEPVTWKQVLSLNRVGGAVTSRDVMLNPPPDQEVPFDDVGPEYVDVAAVGITVVVIGLVLLQIALLAGPAIAVGARRHQRGLAIMSSTGAERRHLRTVVLAGNGVIGLAAGVAAALLGGALGVAVAAWLRQTGRQNFVRIDVHPLDLLGLAAVGVLTAVAAALVPARQAARLDVVAVLTGRRGQVPLRRRVPVLGLSIALIGAVLAVVYSGRQDPFPSVGALALTEIGLITATGAVVALVARVAAWAPFSVRFALRDAARQRGRTVPAVAAVLAAIAGATCALVYIASQSSQEQRTYVPQSPRGTALVGIENERDPVALAKIEATIRQTLPVADLRPYRGAVAADPDGDIWFELVPPVQNQCPINVLRGGAALSEAARQDPRCRPQPDVASSGAPIEVFDDGSAYPLLTGQNDPAAVAALRSGRVVVSEPLWLWPDGTVHVKIEDESQTTEDEEPATRTVVLPATLSHAPRSSLMPFYPLTAAKALGMSTVVNGLVVTSTRMPTEAAEDRANVALDKLAASVSVERGYQSDYGLVLLALVAAAMVVGLGGTFTAVGLAAAESRSDIATLAAVGAGPGVRRRLAAGQAGVIAVLGSVLGVLSGVLAGWVLVRLQRDSSGATVYIEEGRYSVDFGEGSLAWHLALPWEYLLAVGVGLPLLAIAVGYLTTRSRLPLVRRLGQ